MRWVEDFGFLAAVLIAFLYGAAESASVLGFCRGPCNIDHPFPWGLLLILLTLALPKVLGRATAGEIWQSIAGRFGGGRNTPPDPPGGL